jgi:hypothetical protein
MDDNERIAPGRADPWSSLGRRWHRPGGFALLLGILVVGANFKVIFGGETFVLRDFSLFGYPLAAHVRASIWSGELPLWSPFNECGHPFLAQWNTMVLYPFSLFHLVLPLSWSLGVFCLLHQYAGGLGMYFLARKWTRNSHGAALAGVIYAFNGIMQNSLMWPNNIAAFGCLPWVVLAVQSGCRTGGRTLVGAALIAAVQMLTGAPEVILCTWVLLIMVVAGESVRAPRAAMVAAVPRFVMIVVITALLAAVQLVPFFDLVVHSGRFDPRQKLEWFIHWYGWANYFLPYFENIGPQESGVVFHASQFWTHSYYLGLAPWLLLVPALARNRSRLVWLLFASVVVTILLAMGPEGKLYTWLDRLVSLKPMRYPVKFLVFCMITMPLLAAWGIKRLALPKVKELNVHAIVALAMVLAAAVMLMDRLELPEPGRDLAAAKVKVQVGWLVATAAAFMLVAGLSRVRRSLAVLGLLLVLAGDLKWHQTSLSPSFPGELYDLPNPLMARLEGAVYPRGRVLPNLAAQDFNQRHESHLMKRSFHDNRSGMFTNVNLIDRIAQVDGFFSMWLPHFVDIYWKLFNGKMHFNDRLADFVGVTHVNSEKGPRDWIVRETAQPLVTVGRRPVFRPLEQTAAQLREAEFDPAEMVYLPSGFEEEFPIGRVPVAEVEDLQISPHWIRFRVTSPAATVATIAQSHYHWWQADIGGEAVPIRFANRAFQAVPVPAGEHVVTLRYVDWGFRCGAAISLVTLAGCALRLRRRKGAFSAG